MLRKLTIEAFVPDSRIAASGWNKMAVWVPSNVTGEALKRAIITALLSTEVTCFRFNGNVEEVSNLGWEVTRAPG